MLQLADIQPGDVVLDPMCGIGTIPMMAAATTPCAVALAGDIDDELLSQAAHNAAWLQEVRRRTAVQRLRSRARSGCADVAERCSFLQLQCEASDEPMEAWHATERLHDVCIANSGVLPVSWEATELALRSGCVDVIAVDLPFGVVHKVKGGKNGLRVLYSRAICEMARVLRPGGRLVALSTSRRGIEEPLEKAAGMWERVTAHHINNGGALTWIVTAVRTSAPPSAPRTRRPFAALPTRLAASTSDSATASASAHEETPPLVTAVATLPLARKGRNTARALRRAQKRAAAGRRLWPVEWRHAAALTLALAVGVVAAIRAARARNGS